MFWILVIAVVLMAVAVIYGQEAAQVLVALLFVGALAIVSVGGLLLLLGYLIYKVA